MKLVVTGGHHSSAMPILVELKTNYPEVEIHWFGHRHSMKGDKNDTLEYLEIVRTGIPFYELKAGKFYRTFNLIHWLKIPFGFFQALILLIKIKPDLILSFGGYIAVPVVVMGRLMGIPSITHEQTVVAGYANKVIARFVDKILISWRESAKYFPSHKVVFTGLPLRESIKIVKTNNFEVHNGLPFIFIIAGKTGSVKINKVIEEALEKLLSRYNIIHQCGDHSEYKSFDVLSAKYNSFKNKVIGKYYPRKFIFEDEIGEAYHRASVVVSRSGAHTVAELLFLQKQSVLIPIPWVSHNEQYLNAHVLENMGLGVILEESKLNPSSLIQTVQERLHFLEHINRERTEAPKSDYNDPVKLITNEILAYTQKK